MIFNGNESITCIVNIELFLVSKMAGSFQPSHSMMLMFYGYYKQATEGKCTKPKPAFYDVINKAKWFVNC